MRVWALRCPKIMGKNTEVVGYEHTGSGTYIFSEAGMKKGIVLSIGYSLPYILVEFNSMPH